MSKVYDENSVLIANTAPVDSMDAVAYVLAQGTEGHNGRSEWKWVRLANGDLMLGVYPRGETYFHVSEGDAERAFANQEG